MYRRGALSVRGKWWWKCDCRELLSRYGQSTCGLKNVGEKSHHNPTPRIELKLHFLRLKSQHYFLCKSIFYFCIFLFGTIQDAITAKLLLHFFSVRQHALQFEKSQRWIRNASISFFHLLFFCRQWLQVHKMKLR